MRKLQWLIPLVGISILLLGLASFSLLPRVGAQITEYNAKPLVGASIEEVKQAALRYTQNRFSILGKTPNFLLIRSVTTADLPQLGLAEIHFAGQEPPLMLVAMRGDFDVTHLSRGGSRTTPWRVSYIVYVFDLNVGAPAFTAVSPHGGSFRKLLNDPTLPDDGSPDQPAPIVSTLAPSNPLNLPPGAVAPPAALPNTTAPVER